jgi:hypothetical protein
MTLGTLPSVVICARDHPLRAKVWALQANTPDFPGLDEAQLVERFSPTQPAVKSPWQKYIVMPLLLKSFLNQ